MCAVGGWLRDLTRECIESNPGPVHCRGKRNDNSACDCSVKQARLLDKNDPIQQVMKDGKCECGHIVTQHDDVEVPSATSQHHTSVMQCIQEVTFSPLTLCLCMCTCVFDCA